MRKRTLEKLSNFPKIKITLSKGRTGIQSQIYVTNVFGACKTAFQISQDQGGNEKVAVLGATIRDRIDKILSENSRISPRFMAYTTR